MESVGQIGTAVAQNANSIANVAALGMKAYSYFAQSSATRKRTAALNRGYEAQAAASRTQQRLAEIRNVREARENVRKARIASATVLNNAANSGALQSSAVQGGVNSVATQLSNNISFLDTNATLNRESNSYLANAQAQNNNATRAGSQATSWSNIGQIAGEVYKTTHGWETTADILRN